MRNKFKSLNISTKLRGVGGVILLSLVLFFNSCVKNKEKELTDDKLLDGLTEKISITNLSKNDKGSINNFSVVFKLYEEEYIEMKGTFIDSTLVSNLYYTDDNKKWISISNINIDTKDKEWRTHIYGSVMEEAERIKKELDKDLIYKLEEYLDKQPEAYFNTFSKKNDYVNEIPLSYYFHMGVVKAIKRSYDKNTDICDCDIHMPFLFGDTPFFCREDRPIESERVYNLLDSLSSSKDFGEIKFNPVKTFKYLESNFGGMVDINKVDNMMKDEFADFYFNKVSQSYRDSVDISLGIPIGIRRGFWGRLWRGVVRVSKLIFTGITIVSKALISHKISSFNLLTTGRYYDSTCQIYGVTYGSDPGCCGNYESHCGLCTLGCNMHDKDCPSCDPGWYCLDWLGCESNKQSI